MDLPRARRACWNLRYAGLFAAGPVLGLVPLEAIFGMTDSMRWMAFVMVGFSVALLGILFKAEYDRLPRP